MNETFSDLDSIIRLSRDSDTLGFDLRAGTTWIFPTNYPVRDYQYNITQAALHQNTLVSLPTGLGKTFIAAVVMYNFYRWYPMGKIIFMAPTKPLVAQQMEACYNTMAIPKNVSAEMTGSKINTSRAKLWKEKRVFFITPHILQNDIDSVLELAPQIRCIIIDEAHKALGKNANCEAIKKIQKINPNFRVLALSATPGSNFNAIKDVIINLLISHIEVRNNESIDVAPYVFQRKLDKYIIPLTGKLFAVKNEYIKILDRYTRPLLQHNIFTGNCANLTKGRIVLTMKEFKEKGRNHKQYGFILKTLTICVTIYHGYELLIRHGLRAFLQFFKENISKPLINSIGELHAIIEDIDRFLGPIDDVEMLPDGTIPEITRKLVYSHPKFEKLGQILTSHFNQIKDADTRVMVFCEYRESVMEIYTLLLRHRPLIKPRIFLGQAAISQAQQLQAVRMFKSGQCNTLVSTCIGEEGLDVGEVDLIVCFDISSKSPIRMVQRMGRTGRKRDGRVVILVTEGKEEQLLSECLVQRNNMNFLLESQQIKQHLYKNNPKMIPDGIVPVCNKMYITASEPEKPTKKKPERKNTKKNTNTNNNNNNILKTMFNNISSSQSSSRSSNDTKNTTGVFNKTTSKKSTTPTKKQTDIRKMFSKISNSEMNTISEVVIIDDDDDDDDPSEDSEELNALISNIKSYLNTSFILSECEITDNIFDCNRIIRGKLPEKPNFKWTDFNPSVYEKITEDSLKRFSQHMQPAKPPEIIKTDKSYSDDLEKTFEFFKISSTFDLFSDNSDDNENNSFVVNPVIFNNSVGVFNSSRIHETENFFDTNFVPSPPDLFDSSDDEMLKHQDLDNELKVESPRNKTPVKVPDDCADETIVISDSDKELSPVLNKSRFRKFGTQRRLFSQASSTNSNISKDFKQLNDSVVTSKSTQQNPKCVSSPTKFSFIPKETVICQKPKSPEPPKTTTSHLVHNTDFWDESLFEMCDSDDDAFENIQSVSQNQPEPEPEPEPTDPQINIDDSTKQNNLNVSQDSDETIILSFDADEIFENLEKEQEILKQNEQEIVVNTSNIIEKCNKNDNDQSLLSVTQLIDFLNDSKNKTQNVTPVKMNEINSSSNTNTKCDHLISESSTIIDDYITIDDDILKEFEKSDDESSLLSFSQNIKRKVHEDIIKEKNDSIPVSSQKDPNCIPSSSQISAINRNKKFKLQLSTKNKTTTTSSNKVSEEVSMIQTQDSPLKFTRKILNSKKPIILSDSDDDFEVRPKRKEPVASKITPEKKFKRIKSAADISPILSTKNVRSTRSESNSAITSSKSIKTNRKTVACEFIDYEADVSVDEHYESDSEEINDSMLESSFIHDTQSVLDQTDMQAKYLQSIRSPKKCNPFKRPPLPVNINVFSQVENNEDNTYMVDSFCIDSDSTLSQRHGLSYLEMVEAQLEEKLRKEKKRKRIRNVSEDSD